MFRFGFNTQDAVEITSLPLQAHSITPADGAVHIQLDQVITWLSDNQAQSYDVYFGTSATPPLVSPGQSQRAYVPSLSLGQTYYLRIDARNSLGTTTGNVISFSTWDESEIWTTNDGIPVTTHQGEYIEVI